MDINEIVIYLNEIPDYIYILNELIDCIIGKKKNLYFKTTIIDNWDFENKREIDGLEKKYYENKIYLIEIFDEDKRVFNFKLYKEQKYIIDIYFDQYIEANYVEIIIPILINVLKEYIFIAIGEDFLLEYDIDMQLMIKKSSGIGYWIIPQDNKKNYCIIK